VSDLTKLTLAEARAGLTKGDFSSVELTQAFLDAIEAGNRALNDYVLETGEHALARARDSDARLPARRRGRWRSAARHRTSIAPRACAPRPAPTSLASSRRLMNRR
jgi:aspartyl-tRNA(Asn)/glutamyl-tRNA(Gln) amidotransferase subunit A